MKKILGILGFLLLSSTMSPHLFAQSLGQAAIEEMLTKNFKEALPKLLGKGKLLDGLDLADLKIRPGYISVKGKTKWKLTLGKHTKPIRFKGNISTRLKSFGKPDLRVHFPGDRFLFFRKYQNLSDLVNLKAIKGRQSAIPKKNT